jgi:hypothetical protein
MGGGAGADPCSPGFALAVQFLHLGVQPVVQFASLDQCLLRGVEFGLGQQALLTPELGLGGQSCDDLRHPLFLVLGLRHSLFGTLDRTLCLVQLGSQHLHLATDTVVFCSRLSADAPGPLERLTALVLLPVGRHPRF